MDEICPGMLKALDMFWVSWLKCIVKVAPRSGTLPRDWQTGVEVEESVPIERHHTAQPPRVSLCQGSDQLLNHRFRRNNVDAILVVDQWNNLMTVSLTIYCGGCCRNMACQGR